MTSFNTINPATGQIISTYHEYAAEEVKQIVTNNHTAFHVWKNQSLTQRMNLLNKVHHLLLANKTKYASLITLEMGKPNQSAIGEIEKCAWLCKHFAENAASYLAPHDVKTEMSKSYVMYQPLGTIFAIMPWNLPFWQIFRFVGPAIVAGNAILIKPAPITTGCGLAIEKLFLEAGFPENLLRTLILSNEMAAEVIAHPKIAGVTITGSVAAGKIVGGIAVSHLKKIVLELGGNDPYIILEDADLDEAAEVCLQSRLNNSGQVCIAAKRLIVLNAIQKQFQEKLLQKLSSYKMGDPTDPHINLGPLAREDLRATVHKQVTESIAKGAKLVMGGVIPKGPGFYYPITVLTNVLPGMPAYEDEIFGPVISFIHAQNNEEALSIANNSYYGLGAAVFTRNISVGEQFAQQIQAGTCCINTSVKSDPRLPFGGIKSSGFGRELGTEGIREFTNVKTICIK